MLTITVFGALGAKALLLLYIWMVSVMISGALAKSKGYPERAGLGTGMCLTFVGALIWAFMPAKPDSEWKSRKPWQRRHKPTEAEMSGSAATGL